MDPERRLAIAKRGSAASHAKGAGHRWDSAGGRQAAAARWLRDVKARAGFTSETEQRILQRIARTESA